MMTAFMNKLQGHYFSKGIDDSDDLLCTEYIITICGVGNIGIST